MFNIPSASLTETVVTLEDPMMGPSGLLKSLTDRFVSGTFANSTVKEWSPSKSSSFVMLIVMQERFPVIALNVKTCGPLNVKSSPCAAELCTTVGIRL